MQIRSKNGKRTVKLAADEKRALVKAANLCAELGNLAQGDAAEWATRCEKSLDHLWRLMEEPETAAVE